MAHIQTMIKAIRIEYLMLVASLFVLALQLQNHPDLNNLFKPSTLFEYQMHLAFDPGSSHQAKVRTFLPTNNSFQQVISERISGSNGEFVRHNTPNGLTGEWYGGKGSQKILYKAEVKVNPVQFNLDRELNIEEVVDDSYQIYLQETDAIAVHHPEIAQAWQQIAPKNDDNLYSVVNAIYNFTAQMENIPFKGMTTSLTALRLNAASCNGKSRLFVSLARHLGIPAKLVGGVILSDERKKTSHQWVELYIQGHWVPFDPTNKYFAKRPSHYLALYHGDHVLFNYKTGMHFDYSFSSSKSFVSTALYPELMSDSAPHLNLATLFKPFNLPPALIASFLLFPLCALLVTFFRNVIGVQTFGVFVPMLVAISCSYTGLYFGLTAISTIILIAFISLSLLEKARLLVIPRLAATTTIITIVSLLILSVLPNADALDLQYFAVVPVVIVSFIAEKINQLSDEKNWFELISRTITTLVVICICYYYLQSVYLKSLFAFFPICFVAILALQLMIGRWSGIRLSELIRFRNLIKKNEPIIGINERNRDIVYTMNSKVGLALAADKLRTKTLLEDAGIPVPETLLSCASQSEVNQIDNSLLQLHNFALKPNTGSQGNGILLISEREGIKFRTSGQKWLTVEALKAHMANIVSGNFSQKGEQDIAYLEPLIQQHEFLNSLSNAGLADIRVIVAHGKIVAAMLRLPTEQSQGKANLHQGAIGVSICLASGRLLSAKKEGINVDLPLEKAVLPFWQNIKDISIECSKVMPLGYLGVDICIDQSRGPLVLEVNGRPGLEIQNVQDKSLARNIVYSTAEVL